MSEKVDGLGNPIKVGDKVVRVGGKTQYAGVRLAEVIKETNVNLTIQFLQKGPGHSSEIMSSKPSDLVVVNKLLEKK